MWDTIKITRKMKTNKYAIQDREAGNIIDEFPTAQAAISALKSYERTDKKNGDYTENFYQIVPIIEDRIYLWFKLSGNISLWKTKGYIDGRSEPNDTPKQLKTAINNLPATMRIILAEYSRSNRYTFAKNFNHRDALTAFGFSATKHDLSIHFNL